MTPPPTPPDGAQAAGNLEPLLDSVREVLRAGLPLLPSNTPDALLALDGVTARSVLPHDPLARLDGLDRLFKRELRRLGLVELRRPAAALFGLTGQGGTLTERRRRAAELSGYEFDHLRKRIEPRIVEQLSWQLHQDSLQYVQRGDDGQPFSVSGDTPTISEDDIADVKDAEREALLSDVWSRVYALRAALIRREVTVNDPSHAQENAQHAETALWRLGELLVALDRFLDAYGNEILHGAASYNAEGLIRLAGWTGELSTEDARELRWRVVRPA